jgi:chemotaxis protein MotA
MYFLLCNIIVIGSVISGYILHHGNLAVLYQPTEYLIIGGAGVGAFMLSNPFSVVKKACGSLKVFLKSGTPYKKPAYTELLLFQYEIYKFAKVKGMLEVESHIEDPHNSDLFHKYPSFSNDHHAVDFFCDYFRLMTMGVDNPYVLDDMMTAELDAHHEDDHTVGAAIVNFGESFPALGIVAAVLGVIITMGSISEPPEILGGLIAAALVGTFLGIFLCYGMIAPMGNYVIKYYGEKAKYMECLKVGILAHAQGNAPAVSVEFARKVIPGYVMPSFKEMEEAIEGAS